MIKNLHMLYAYIGYNINIIVIKHYITIPKLKLYFITGIKIRMKLHII